MLNIVVTSRAFVCDNEGRPLPDLSDFKPLGTVIEEPKPAYSAVMVIEDEGAYIPVIIRKCAVEYDEDGNPGIMPLSGITIGLYAYHTSEPAMEKAYDIYRDMMKEDM